MGIERLKVSEQNNHPIIYIHSFHNITQLLDCVPRDQVSHEHNSLLIMGYYVLGEP